MFVHKLPPYLLSLLAAEVRRVEGLDLDALLIGRPQPGVVLRRPAALLLPGAPLHPGRRREYQTSRMIHSQITL